MTDALFEIREALAHLIADVEAIIASGDLKSPPPTEHELSNVARARRALALIDALEGVSEGALEAMARAASGSPDIWDLLRDRMEPRDFANVGWVATAFNNARAVHGAYLSHLKEPRNG